MAKKTDLDDLKEENAMMKDYVQQQIDVMSDLYQSAFNQIVKMENIVYNRDEPYLEKYTAEFIKHKEGTQKWVGRLCEEQSTQSSFAFSKI